jgi:hypothetical protein
MGTAMHCLHPILSLTVSLFFIWSKLKSEFDERCSRSGLDVIYFKLTEEKKRDVEQSLLILKMYMF